MKYYLTQEEMDKIEILAEYALSAYNKQDAKTYILQINFLVQDIYGASRSILNEMISSVSNATGRVSDKERKKSIARQQIIKAQMLCVKNSETKDGNCAF